MSHIFDVVDAAPQDVVFIALGSALLAIAITDSILRRKWRSR